MRIVWLDDDGELLENAVVALRRAGYVVDMLTNVGDAWKFLEENAPTIDGLILDIMMATGELLSEENTNGGMRAGAVFLRKFLQNSATSGIKVFVYTIVEDEAVRTAVSDLKIKYFRKQSYPGQAIVQLVREEFGEVPK
ncbi:MAG: hypothetical protein AB7F78_05705 [Hyphomicrobiaceae bacterium]